MKYIKKYETWPDYIHFYSLKKYVICKNTESNIYTVFELIKSTENFYIEVQTIAFSKRTDKIAKSLVMEVKLSLIQDRIVFQSDDLEEIRNQMELLNQTDKFNL